MRKTLKLLLILSAIIMTACHNDEQEIDISWTQEAARMVHGGIKTDFEHKTISLDFSADTQIELSSSSSENWIKPTVTFSDGKGQLSIEILENNTLSSREGKVIFIAQGKVVTIKVFQEGNPKVIVDKNIYYQGFNGGNIEIHVKAKGELSAGIYPADCKWARVIKTIPSGNNEYTITVTIDKNEGLGRVASIDFKIDGKTANQDCGPCLVQEPAPFTNTTTIMCEKPGCLQVLMGNDLTNLRRIRSLKLIGNINGLDFLLLRKLFLDTTESFSQYPVDIDISKCNIVAGNQNPYEYFGWQPSKIFEGIFMYGKIPTGIFTNAVNLKNIILPHDLKIIGKSAFAGCKSLKTIDIPADVEEINSKAFYGCMSLQEINLTSNECLTSIGNQAFTTKSTLNELTIPATVVNVGVEAFLGCSVLKLHLKWSEPLEVRIVPKTDGCTLYVPKGTKGLYRNTRNWSKFLNVIEE
ncbi:MAG: leucine-rich repeat protein [Prevotella sp.]|nr:leucine-rich repeat protein [Prevotella sp.]MDY4217494.1 leucine-rich repeat protein [Prevotella sp.]